MGFLEDLDDPPPHYVIRVRDFTPTSPPPGLTPEIRTVIEAAAGQHGFDAPMRVLECVKEGGCCGVAMPGVTRDMVLYVLYGGR